MINGLGMTASKKVKSVNQKFNQYSDKQSWQHPRIRRCATFPCSTWVGSYAKCLHIMGTAAPLADPTISIKELGMQRQNAHQSGFSPPPWRGVGRGVGGKHNRTLRLEREEALQCRWASGMLLVFSKNGVWCNGFPLSHKNMTCISHNLT